MQIKKIELGILLIISVVVIADGISLVKLDRMRAGESGTYVILLGILLLILAAVPFDEQVQLAGHAEEWLRPRR